VALFNFRVLGPLEVRRDGQEIRVPAPKQRALLGLLLLHANEPLSPERLVDELWGEAPPPTARESLRNHVHALRRLLGPDVLERRTSGYVLHVEAGELDLAMFARLVAEARRAEPRERAAKLRSALALWRGPPLVEFPSEPFAQHEIARLEEERLSALEDRIEVDLELGQHAALVPELESLVQRYPLREAFWGQLMLALYRAGRQAEALAAYRRAHRKFVDELGLEPGVRLRDLQRAILVQDEAIDDREYRPGLTLERAAAILPAEPGQRAESLYEYGLALFRTGERWRGIATLESAARMALAVGDQRVEEWARLDLAYLSIWTGGTDATAFIDLAERAARRFEERGDAKGLSLALRRQYHVLPFDGRTDEAAAVALRAADLAAERGDTYEEAAALMNRAELLAEGTTPVPAAIAECERILDDGEQRGIWGTPPLPLRALRALGVLYSQAGRPDDARSVLDRAIGRARDFGLVWFLIGLGADRGWVELYAGDLNAAVEHLRSAYALVDTEQDFATKPETGARFACVLVRAGQADEAKALAQQARAESTGDLFTEVVWRRALALVAARERRFDEALTLAAEARRHVEATDWLTVRGETLEDAALVHRLAGDVSGEADALAEALALYERKGNVSGVHRITHARAPRR
jgi:DNA-binding SARP family transcriptional activator